MIFLFSFQPRIVSVEPNDLVGIVGEHEDFPVERMRLSHDKKYLASSSHDNSIKFWNINYLYDDDNDDGEEEDGEAGDMAEEENGGQGEEDGEEEEGGMDVDEHQPAKNKGKGRALDQDDDDEEEEEEGENSGPKKKKQKKRGKKGFYSDM